MDTDTLDILVRAHQAAIYRYVRYMGADAAVADDLVQDTFLTAFKIRKYPDPSDTRGCAAWLRAIARNIFLRHCRREKNRRVIADSEYVEQAEAVWAGTFLRDGDGFEYLEALRECLELLSEKQRHVLNMRYAEKRGRGEMADLLKMTENGVKALLRRLRSALGDCVERRLAAEGVG
ncbi:MAG: sigma-70 family RNA polymerase sigma factor [Kiritimatiellae bacterium]|nr:sigma-70 family RNA polymerase sigma factor [Kiritimatiellia bacterium]